MQVVRWVRSEADGLAICADAVERARGNINPGERSDPFSLAADGQELSGDSLIQAAVRHRRFEVQDLFITGIAAFPPALSDRDKDDFL